RNMTSLVIDLRNNPGGLLKDVVSIADTLLGECTIVTVRDGKGSEETYTSNKKGVSLPVAIIVNENSASASEILAAAVQDNEAGVVVGMTTFGKGVVQNTKRISSNGAWLKMTVSAYYTPGGESINGTGVTPDIEVDLPEEMKGTPIDQLDQEQDAQLWAALDYVRELAGEQ
ncbi:MAG: S41 family peptidase, partial [Clostridium sp.]|nr:S41 family peptidase [Clostridium sp.]